MIKSYNKFTIQLLIYYIYVYGYGSLGGGEGGLIEEEGESTRKVYPLETANKFTQWGKSINVVNL